MAESELGFSESSPPPSACAIPKIATTAMSATPAIAAPRWERLSAWMTIVRGVGPSGNGGRAGTGAGAGEPSKRSSSRASLADAGRSSRSFAVIRSTSVTRAGGASFPIASRSTTPAAKRSVRSSAGSPSHSSGAMKFAVPGICPVCVSEVASSGRATPKSVRHAVPRAVKRTLPGLTSRWMIPADGSPRAR